jgi:hypothetical protein
MACNLIKLIFNNSKCIELRGCVLYGYRNGQKVAHDGVRPCPTQDGILFSVSAPDMTHWRWVGAADYSDEPENTDVVLIDTGIRPATKCDWTVTCNPHQRIDRASAEAEPLGQVCSLSAGYEIA